MVRGATAGRLATAWTALCVLGLSLFFCAPVHAQTSSVFKEGVQQRLDTAFVARRGLTAATIGTSKVTNAASNASQSAASGRIAASFKAMRAARATQASLSHALAASASTALWQSAGPTQVQTAEWGSITGRISSIAVDPNDTSGNTVYVGATGGGVWKSTNAASSNPAAVIFIPLTDDISDFANSNVSVPSLSIGALAVQPGDSQVLLAGTGDPNDALDSYYGVGILRSADGGKTWKIIKESHDTANGSENYQLTGLGFAGFAWSTSNTNLVVAAASVSREGELIDTLNGGSSQSFSPMAGLYYSQDAGQTWYLATITDGTGGAPVQSPSYLSPPPGNAVTSVVWDPQRALFVAAVRFHGYYSSPDGMTWTRLASQPGAGLTLANCPTNSNRSGSMACPIFRGALALQAATGDLFALTTDLNNGDRGLFQDVCSASGIAVSICNSQSVTFGRQISDTAFDDPENPGVIDQADYNLALAAIPSQGDTLIFAGTEDLFRCSLANSCAWRNTTNTSTCASAKVAPEFHAIASSNAAQLFFGNDGGLLRSVDGVAQAGSICSALDSTHYDNLNPGLGSLAELTDVAVSPSDPSIVLAGMGEFGTVTSSGASGSGVWSQLLNGEGSTVAIDPQNAANWYAGNGPAVNIGRCTDGSTCNGSDFGSAPTIGPADVAHDADYDLTPAPWILDPLDTANILLGTCRVWLGPATGDWASANAISAALDGSGDSPCDGDPVIGALGAGGSYNSSLKGETVYLGMAGPASGGSTLAGHVYRGIVPQGATSSSNIAWTDLWKNGVTNSLTTQFNPGQYGISSIAVDPHDSTGNTIYVGIASYPAGGGGGIFYGSTDGGAHWANLTNTLPLAPVNSIVVDPSNPNIVYVGGDFGVYSTNNITTCSNTSQSCWGQLSAGLPNAPITKLVVYGSASGNILEAATYGRGLWTLGLATSLTTVQAKLAPAGATFAAAGVGTKSTTTATFTLTSSGSATLEIGSILVTPASDYAQTNTCGASIGASASCTITVTFTPSATGDRPGLLSVITNAVNGTQTATLDGTGLTPGKITVSPATLSFPATATGATSAPENISLANTGGAPVTLGSASITGAETTDFSLAAGNTCGASLAAGATCVVPVVFAPVQTGTRTTQFSITGSAPGSPYTAILTGPGVLPARVVLAPTSLTFATTAVGSTTASQTIAVSNSGGVAAQLGTPSIAGEYTITSNSCGSTLQPSGTAGSSCAVSIAFAPKGTGSRAGLFTLPSASMPAGQVTAPLSGTGVPAPVLTLTPGSLTFGNTAVGTTSSAQAFTIKNTGGSAASIGSATTGSADFAIQGNTCPASLAVGATCTVGIVFQPAAVGARSGTFTLPYGSASATAQLTGTGTAPAQIVFSPASVSFGAVEEDTTSAVQVVTVSNPGTAGAAISGITVSGPFAITAGGTCGSGAQTITAGASCTLDLVFAPPSVGNDTGALTLSGTFSNTPAVLPLSGQGATPPGLSAAPASLTFPDTAEGAASAAQNITLTSTGGVAAKLGTPSISSDYQVSGDNCPSALAPGNSCTLSVLFRPTVIGTDPGTLSIPSNITGGSLRVALNGNGLQPGAISLTPEDLEFGQVALHATAGPQPVTVRNTGGASIALGTVSITGDYALTGNTCPATLGSAQTCSLSVSFTPTASGARPGQLSAGGATTLLNGTGAPPGQLVASPGSVAFGIVGIGATANATVMVTNSGGFPVHLASLTAGGDFRVSGGSCSAGTTLAPNSANTCTVQVAFTPSLAGTRTGTLSIANDGATNPQVVGLAGIGAAAGTLSIAPTTHDFGSLVIAGGSASFAFTASNSGGVAVDLQSPVVSGTGFSLLTNGCGSTLAAGAHCSLTVGFAPQTSGSTTGTLQLAGASAGTTTQIVASATLSGTGVTPGVLTLSPSPVVFGSIVTGASAIVPVSVTNTGGASVTLGKPAASTGFSVTSNCPSSLSPQAACQLSVTYTPTASGSASGLLTLPANVAGGAVTDALSGTGVAPGALSAAPGSLTFAATEIGVADPSAAVIFSNPGGVAVPLSAPSVSSADFAITASTCSASLAAGASCSVNIAFNPAASGARSATLTLGSSTAGGPSAHVALSGMGLAHAALQWTPGSLAFSTQQVRTTSASQVLTLTNSGGVGTSLALPVLTGPFQISSNSCTTSLAAGAQCSIGVLFAPTQGGAAQGSLKASAAGGNPSAIAALSGTGQALALNPTSLTFAPLPVGKTSAPQSISVENLNPSAIPLGAASITGDFAISASSCGSSLPADTTCVLFLTFTPTAGGQRTGTFSITNNGETHTATLTGTGLSPATDTLSAVSLGFPLTQIGRVSPEETVTMNNTGDATLAGITTSVTGPFIVINNCGASLGGHLGCQIAVEFAPTANGEQSGTLTITDSLRSQTVSLSGEGALPPQAVAAPTSIDFGPYALGITTGVQTVTVYNNGVVPMNNIQTAIAGSSFSIASSNCGTGLTAGASCQIGVVFTAAATGAQTGVLTISSTASGAPLQVSLGGSGEDFTLSVVGDIGDIVTEGSTATYHLAVTPVGSSQGQVMLSCTGLPADATCTPNPSTLTVGGGNTGSVTLSIATGVTPSSSALRPRWLWTGGSGGAMLALAFPFLFGADKRRRARLLAAVGAILLASLPLACGVHASGAKTQTKTPPGNTPAGEYNISVSASFPGAQRSVIVKLIVE